MNETTDRSGLVALIPARGGSKGVPKKNIKMIGGKPLLAHSIEFALSISEIDRVFVSTDSQEIADTALEHGAEVPFLRPADLADDSTPMYDTVKHFIDFLRGQKINYEYLALLQPTSPFRRRSDFMAAFNTMLTESEIDSVVSLDKVPIHFSPDFLMRIDGGVVKPFMGAKVPIARRQDSTPAYARNGQFYLGRISSFSDDKAIYGDRSVPFITSHEAVNIDTVDDWDAAVRLMMTWSS